MALPYTFLEFIINISSFLAIKISFFDARLRALIYFFLSEIIVLRAKVNNEYGQ